MARRPLIALTQKRESWAALRVAYRMGWRFFNVFLPRKRSVVRLDAAREIDGKRKRMLTSSNIVLHLNIGDPARLFVTNNIQASIYPIHCNAIPFSGWRYMNGGIISVCCWPYGRRCESKLAALNKAAWPAVSRRLDYELRRGRTFVAAKSMHAIRMPSAT